jgi:hypothetical protein
VPPNIQVVEMARDQSHPYVGLGALAQAAMTSTLQGTRVDPVLGTISTAPNSVNMFGFLNHRLLFGANYLTKYNLGFAVDFVPTYINQTATGQIASAPTTGDRGVIQAALGPLYNYYRYFERRADMDTSESSRYLAQAFNKIYPEGDNQDLVGHSILLYTLDDKANLARTATLSASSSHTSGSTWGLARIADGRTGSDDYSKGWSSANATSQNHSEWVKFDLGSVTAINQVDLYPRTDGPNLGYGFPVDFTIDVSTDNASWTTVISRSGHPMPTDVQKFNFALHNARYIRVLGSSLRPNPNDSGQYRMQFAEARIYGGYASTGATLVTSSTMENADWGMDRSVDGKRSALPASMGWSSTASAATFTESLTLELGSSETVGEVNLYPRSDGANAGYGYPIDLAIDTSVDGSTWTNAVSRTSLALPANGAVQAFTFGARSARYVRIQGTRHRANPNENNVVRMQLAEVEVY